MEIELPAVFDVPIFPLPESVLFPGMVLPLHIFEPRYRTMLAQAMKGEKLIAMALLCPGYEKDYEGAPPVRPVVGVGRIAGHQALPNGTSNIALIGLARCRIRCETQATPFRVATVETLMDEPPDCDDPDRRMKAAHAELLKSAQTLMRRALKPEGREQLAAALKEHTELGRAADYLASIFVREAETRQQLLETLDVIDRAEAVREALDRFAQGLEPEGPPAKLDYGDVSLN